MMFFAEADWDFYKALAMRSANIPGWEKEPHQDALKSYGHIAAEKMPQVDKSYEIMKG